MNTESAILDTRHVKRARAENPVPVFYLVLGILWGIIFLRSPFVGMLLPFAVLGFLAAIRYPERCWKVWIAFTVLVPSFLPPPVASMIFWVLMTTFLFAAWREEKIYQQLARPEYPAFWFCIALWLGWCAVSALFSMNFSTSLKEITRYAISFLTLFTYTTWIKTEKRLWDIFGFFKNTTIILTVLYLLERLIGLITRNTTFSLLGSYPPSDSEMGIVFSTAAPFVLVSLLFSKQPKSAKTRIPDLIIFLAMCAATLLCKSRAACLALGVSTLIILWQSATRRVRFALSSGLLAGMILLFALTMKGADHAPDYTRVLSGRDRLWKAALSAFSANPLTGIGPGCWSEWLSKNYVSADFLFYDKQGHAFYLPLETLGGEAHNLFLTKLAEMGIASLVGLGAIFILWSKFARKVNDLAKQADYRFAAVSLAGMASLTGLAFFCLFENGPIIGKARGIEIALVWLPAALPWIINHLLRSTKKK